MVAILSACRTEEPQRLSDPSVEFSSIAQRADALIEQKHLPGIGILVVQPQGTLWQHTSGTMSGDRPSLVASPSKSISALVIAALFEKRGLDLDAPIGSLVPWASHRRDITMAQLLSNSSGMEGIVDGKLASPYPCQYLPAGTLRECGQLIASTDADASVRVSPDSVFRYGGAQWQLAGAVAEAIAGVSWAELVREEIALPCDTPSLRYGNHFEQFDQFTRLAYPAAFPSQDVRETLNPNIEAGAIINMVDMAKLLQMHLNGGRCGDRQILSEAGAQRLRTDRIITYQGSTGSSFQGYGLGWWVDRQSTGLVEDPGALGAVPWIDTARGYAGYLIVESTSADGRSLVGTLRPMIQDAIDRINREQ